MNTSLKTSLGRRRGVLLLVVLSTLIVFLLLGTLLLTQATRSRTAARAFATVNASSASNGALAREVLDEALMQLVRGGSGSIAGVVECLLGDKYGVGAEVQAKASLIDDTVNGVGDKSLIQVNVEDLTDLGGIPLSPSPNPITLNGRLVSFTPAGGQSGDHATYRILRASEIAPGEYQCFLANHNPEPGVQIPSAPCDVIINGREYSAEAHDSYADDGWLTEITFSDAVPTIVRPAFEDPALYDKANPYDWDANNDGKWDDAVDNDGDGVPDGTWRPAAWRDEVLPNRIASDGIEYQFDVSYLVLDLDSRVNVNIHGPMVRPPANAWDWANAPSGTTPGFGWGVCDVDSAALFKDYGTNDLSANVAQYLDSKDVSTGSPASGTLDYRASPYIGDIDGRFGQGGTVLFDSTTSEIRNLLFGDIPAIDMQGLMKVFAVPGSGTQGTTLKYAKPSLASDPYGASRDPYLTRLDSSAPRLNVRKAGGSVSENPFSVAELERILRHFDADVNGLPQRLAGLLGDEVQRARLFLTTDSWDTPALTGAVARDVINEMTNQNNNPGDWPTPLTQFAAPYDVISPDIASGMRFDVNRPFSAVDEDSSVPADAAKIEARKQEYCKHLFTLLYAIDNSLNTAAVAQWVANVVDYRDSDSTMTRFTFDDDPSDGWNPPSPDPMHPDYDVSRWESNTVWGNERADVVIAQTLAWYKQANSDDKAFYVMLYRPPVEMIEDGSGNQTPAVPLDDNLAAASSGPGKNQLELAKVVPNTHDPVWRMRYDGTDDSNSKFVRFDGTLVADYAAPFTPGNTSASSAAQTTQLDGGKYILVKPGVGSSQPEPGGMTIDPALPTFSIGTNDANYTGGLGIEFGVGSGYSEIHLERLANPALGFNSNKNDTKYNPYVSVGSFPIFSYNNTGGTDSNAKAFERGHNGESFWKTPVGDNGGALKDVSMPIGPLDATNRDLLLWPNRPFVSQVELAMVPPGSGDDVFENYLVPGAENYHYLSKMFELAGNNSNESDANARALLESTIVPSRVYGSAEHYTSPGSDLEESNPDYKPIGYKLESVGFGTSFDKDGNPFDVVPLNQLTHGREPGRVNLNLLWTDPDVGGTAGYSDHGGWLAMLGQAVTDDVAEGFSPKTTLASMFDLKGQGGLYVDGDPAIVGSQEQLYPLFAYKTAIKLGNVATIRSNVFAVWITLRVRNTQTDEKTYHRLFAIVDRSIPVAFAPGQDLNTANTIRLKRYLN